MHPNGIKPDPSMRWKPHPGNRLGCLRAGYPHPFSPSQILLEARLSFPSSFRQTSFLPPCPVADRYMQTMVIMTRSNTSHSL